MSGLVLKLAPNERLLINGAVIENGARRTRLSIKTAEVNILRLRDAIHPDEARTPVSRACYEAQLVLSGDRDADQGQLFQHLEQLSRVFDRDSRKLLADATESVLRRKFYPALKAPVIFREARPIGAGR